MTTPLYANDVATTLAAPVADGTVTTFTLASATGWPVPAAGEHVPAVVVDTSTSPETVKEYVWVTALSGVTATVTRQAEDAARFPKGALAAGLTLAAVATAGALSATVWGTPVLISTAAADWTVEGGTWDFGIAEPDVIQTTDGALNASGVAVYNALVPGASYVVQADVNIPTGQDPAWFGDMNLTVGAQSSSVLGDGFDVTSPIGAVSPISINIFVSQHSNDVAAVTAFAQGEWHTYRTVCIGGARGSLYADGAYVTSHVDSATINGADRLVLLAVGLAKIRNIKVWALTPTVP